MKNGLIIAGLIGFAPFAFGQGSINFNNRATKPAVIALLGILGGSVFAGRAYRRYWRN